VLGGQLLCARHQGEWLNHRHPRAAGLRCPSLSIAGESGARGPLSQTRLDGGVFREPSRAVCDWHGVRPWL
jgi:hypothetical protein